MYKDLAKKLKDNRDLWLDIEKETGVTSVTMRAIIKAPKAGRHKVVIYALNTFFNNRQKESND